jgi:hypothetical protein
MDRAEEATVAGWAMVIRWEAMVQADDKKNEA